MPRVRPESMPPWLRPKMSAEQLRDLAMAHNINLGAFVDSTATPEILWQWAGGAMTWALIAQAMAQRNEVVYGNAHAMMIRQMGAATAAIARYRETRSVKLTEDEIAIAREATIWADELAALVDQLTASMCAEAAERAIWLMQTEVEGTHVQIA